jgi:hypothetical protein
MPAGCALTASAKSAAEEGTRKLQSSGMSAAWSLWGKADTEQAARHPFREVPKTKWGHSKACGPKFYLLVLANADQDIRPLLFAAATVAAFSTSIRSARSRRKSLDAEDAILATSLRAGF